MRTLMIVLLALLAGCTGDATYGWFLGAYVSTQPVYVSPESGPVVEFEVAAYGTTDGGDLSAVFEYSQGGGAFTPMTIHSAAAGTVAGDTITNVPSNERFVVRWDTNFFATAVTETAEIRLTVTEAGQAPNVSTSGPFTVDNRGVRLSGDVFSETFTAGDSLAMSVVVSDNTYFNPLSVTATVTGGTLTPGEAGFNETFPVVVSGMTSPQTLSLTGTATKAGTIELTFTGDDNDGQQAVKVKTVTIEAGPAAQITIQSGDNQSARPGAALPNLCVVRVDDGYGNPVVTTLDVTPLVGRGSVPLAQIVSGVEGTASTAWTMSRKRGLQTLRISSGVASATFRALVPVFDFNGDGFDDLVVGAFEDDSAGTDAGAVYVFYGSATPPSTLASTSADVVVLGNSAGDRGGVSARSVGDVNGDGYDDLLVGAYLDASSQEGRAFLFLGSSSPSASMSMSSISGAAMVIEGVGTNTQLGIRVGGIGDVNGDGYDDMAIGAWRSGSGLGAVYIFYGGTSVGGVATTATADIAVTGSTADGRLGRAVALGYVDGDAYADIVVGAMWGGTGQSGSAYVIRGGPSLPTSIQDTESDVVVTAATAGGHFGAAVAIVDANGDGFGDVAIGAPGVDTMYLFVGESSLPSTWSTVSADQVVSGPVGSFGEEIASLEVNGDGYEDVTVGAHQEDVGGADAGSASIYFGAPTLPATRSGSDFRVFGGGADDQCGAGISGLDWDHNGLMDLGIGVRGASSAGVVLGNTGLAGAISVGAADTLITAPANSSFGKGMGP